MKAITLIFCLALAMTACDSPQEQKNKLQPYLVGGACEGCEAILEYGNRNLTPVDTLPGFQENDTKIKVTGIIFQPDGKTPADDVIMYIYHTNPEGIYEAQEGALGWEKAHGSQRGWIKTDCSGMYTFYTSMPGPYPGRKTPAHIHPIILEPDGKYYWLGSFHFEGDSLLTEKEISPQSPRGASTGLLKLELEGDVLVGRQDIILGENINDYHSI